MRQRAFALAVIIICFTAAYASAISLRIATTSSGSDAGATVADTAADTEVLVGSGAGTAAWVAMSGDATIANTGAVTVANESHDHTTTTISGLVEADLGANVLGTASIDETAAFVFSALGATTATSFTSALFTSNNADPADTCVFCLGTTEKLAWEDTVEASLGYTAANDDYALLGPNGFNLGIGDSDPSTTIDIFEAAGADAPIIQFQDGDITGMTALFGTSFGALGLSDSSALMIRPAGATGGAILEGFTNSGSVTSATLSGRAHSGAISSPPVRVLATKSNGSGSVTSMGANEPVFAVVNNATDLLTIDAEGDAVIPATGSLKSPIFSSTAADPADTGLLRGGNAENLVCAEASPAGTDKCISLDSEEKWLFGSANANLKSLIDFDIEAAATRDIIFRETDAGDGRRWRFDFSEAGKNFHPIQGNVYDIGTTALPVRTLYLQTSIQGANSKTLTEASATSFVEISITSGSLVGGVVEYVVHAGDGTDIQSLAGSVHFAAVNKAGTETCTIGTAFGEVVAVSTGTLTNTFTCVTTPTNGIRLQANATSSLTQTALNFLYRVHINSGTATITPQ